jgi:16S rRNA (guanine527-N7)-methyltransferase
MDTMHLQTDDSAACTTGDKAPADTTVCPQLTALWLQQAQALLGTPLSEALLGQLTQLHALLVTANQHTNLTRLITWKDFLYRHVLEALWLCQWIPQGASVVDVGCGAGFPLLPMALFREDLTLLGVESVGKKAAFIEQAIAALDLKKRVRVSTERAEVLGQHPAYRERYQVACARAVAALPTLVEYTLPLVKVGGTVLAAKGPSWQEEWVLAEQAVDVLGGGFEAIVEPPVLAGEVEPLLPGAFVVMLAKVEPTPRRYPRTVGLPSKEPIGVPKSLLKAAPKPKR